MVGSQLPDNLLDNIAELICTANLEGFFEYLSPYWQDVLGWTLDELRAKPFIEFIHPEDQKLTFKITGQLLNDKQVIKGFINRYATKSGGYRYLEWNARLVDNKYIYASARDVTDKVMLQIQNQKFSDLIESHEQTSSIGHWQLDLVNKKVHWSDEIYAMIGMDKGSYQPAFDSPTDIYHPEDVEKVQRFTQEALKKHHEWAFQCRIVRSCGEVRNVTSKASIQRDSQGNPTFVYGILRDVTDIYLVSEERDLLSQVVKNAITGVVISDAKKNIIWVNEAFTDISGYTLADVKGQTLGKFLQGKDTDIKTIESIKSNLAIGSPVNVEILNYHKNGKPYWNNLIISPIRKDGVIYRYVGLQHDITERVERNKLNASIEHMDSIGELAAGISHDFNNILAIIDGNREILNLKSIDNQKLYLDNIGNAVTRAKNLTKKILKTSKKSGTKSVNICIKNCMLELKKLTEHIIPNNISLSWRIEPTPIVHIDVDDFEDAVINMIANAQNAIEHHGHITISNTLHDSFDKSFVDFAVKEPPQSDKYLSVSIKDTGSGIERDMLGKIFEPFYTTRSQQQGTGLGLAMVAGFVTRQNLGLTVNTEPGVGSEFTLWIPVETEGAVPSVQEPNSEVEELSTQLKLVMIDDEHSITEVYGELLESLGYKVTCFNEPDKAYAWLQEHINNVDIIVTDEVMPGPIQGKDIFNRFVDEVPVLIASGFIDESPQFFTDRNYLKKPYSLAMLSDAIEKAINQHN